MTRFNLRSLCSLSFVFLVGFAAPAPIAAADPSLLFDPNQIKTTLGEVFTVSIKVDTGGYESGGVGSIIIYDPYMFAATTIQTGQIFTDYPMSSINNEKGKITISGIAASTEHLFSGSGEFAKVTFKPIQIGQSEINFAFQPGLTTDSNIAVTFGNGDILTKINKIEITTLPSSNGNYDPNNSNILTQFTNLTFESFKNKVESAFASLPFSSSKYASAREGRVISKDLDPLGPLVAQKSITDSNESQSMATINKISFNNPLILPAIIAWLVAIIGILLILLIQKRTPPTN